MTSVAQQHDAATVAAAPAIVALPVVDRPQADALYGLQHALQIGVEDDGHGIAAMDLSEGRGLDRASMRAQALGGSLRIEMGRDGRGTHCTLIVPLF